MSTRICDLCILLLQKKLLHFNPFQVPSPYIQGQKGPSEILLSVRQSSQKASSLKENLIQALFKWPFHCSTLIQTSSSACHSVSKSREGSSGSRNNGLYLNVFLGSNKHARHLGSISCLQRAALSMCNDTLHILS